METVMTAKLADVLVAEDNPLNFELVRDLLDARGHAVEWARDGEEALRLARTGRFDLLLLDLHMPRLDGLEVIRAIRAEPPDRPLKVIALTADAMVGVREDLFAAGVDGYLSKPLDLGALIREMETVGV
jgi:two-component system cell cycle response regulator